MVDSTLTDPLLGAVLDGRYRVDAVLARGGMSIVYTGTDLRLERPVAVKVMSPALAGTGDFAEKFTREARSAARLSHPNVVSVYDQGSDHGHTFLIMELVRGRTLRDLLRHGPVSPALAVTIMESVLSALAAAHRAGLVHRDIKPENVLLSVDGAVKVADFGLARAVAQASASQTAVVMGTVAYVAPEQVSHGLADARSDVYSAGILLYELLTGAPPYHGDHAVSVAYRHVHDDVPPPSATDPRIQAPLDQLTVRVTRRDPSARPADAAAFLAELRAARSALGLPTVAIPTSGEVGAEPGATIPATLSHPAGSQPTSSQPTSSHLGGFPLRGSPDRPHPTAMLPAAMLPEAQAVPLLRPLTGPPPYTEQQRYRRRHRIGLAVVLAVGLVVGSIGWWYGTGRWATVPAVDGMARQSAVNTLAKAGLKAAIGTAVYDDGHRSGTVARTDPPAGHQVILGHTVTLHLSKGPAPSTVPDVRGDRRADAVDALASLGLTVRVTQVPDNSVSPGRVTRTFPGAGSPITPNMSITLYLSTGPGRVRIPDVTGQDPDAATATLRDVGLVVSGQQQQQSDSVPAGKVAGTDPAAGKNVDAGSSVQLLVSAGATSVTVPLVIGMSRTAAVERLKKAGFAVNVTGLLGQKRGTVFSQDPPPFTSAPAGSTVTIGLI
ncbi:MAG: Stk1 family PASTA domain-containing Ser/Thr kinase [Actinobacteria bacterium]|nr:Stk1 family PASTA domain-containing Ser/Thr kinase [Actinomycetota bacterium]